MLSIWIVLLPLGCHAIKVEMSRASVVVADHNSTDLRPTLSQYTQRACNATYSESRRFELLGLGEGSCLQNGAYGAVYRVGDVAVKIQELEVSDGMFYYLSEIAIMNKFNVQRGFVKIHKSAEDKEKDTDDKRWGYFQMELAPEGNYGRYVRRHRDSLKPNDYAAHFFNIALHVLIMHRKGFVHRDLKADNILMFDLPKVGDMGAACKSTDLEPAVTTSSVPDGEDIIKYGFEKFKFVCYHLGPCRDFGTLFAPETWARSLQTKNSSCEQYFPPACDIWSLGLLLVDVLGGDDPGFSWAEGIAELMRDGVDVDDAAYAKFGPTPGMLKQLDRDFEGQGCVKQLLSGMLVHIKRRLNIDGVLGLAMKWYAQEPCEDENGPLLSEESHL